MEAFINGTEDIRQPTSKPRIRPRNSRIRSRKTGHSTVTQTVLSFWRSCGRALLMYSFKYNQQDETLYNVLYYCQCSTCFRQFFRPSSGAQELYTWHRVYAKLKQAWHIPDVVCTVLELLMMGGKTAWNTYSIDNNKEDCITLHLFGYT